MKKYLFRKTICLTAVLALFYVSSIAQQVGVSDINFTPQALLHVYKSTAGPSKLFQLSDVTSGNGASNGLTFDVDASFNIFMNNNQSTYLGFKTGGTERMRITSAGFVGINTTGATGGVPGYMFHIFGGTGSITQTIATIEGNSLTSGKGLYITTNNSSFAGYLEDAQATDATNTSAYTVIHAVAAGNNGQGILAVKSSTSVATAGALGGINFSGRIATIYSQTATPNTIAVFGNASDNTATASIGVWGIAANGANNIGVVGIGGLTSTYTTGCTGGAGAYFYGQAYGLYSIGANGVAGNFIRATSETATTQAAVSLEHQTTAGTISDGFGAGLLYYIYPSGGSENLISRIDAIRNGANNSGRLAFSTSNAGTMAEKMTILANGDVGIGKSSPIHLLQVNDNIGVTSDTVVSIYSPTLTTGVGMKLLFNALSNGMGLSIRTNSLAAGILLDVRNTSTSGANTAIYVSNSSVSGNAIEASGVGNKNYSAIFAHTAPNAAGLGFDISTSAHALVGEMKNSTNAYSYCFGVLGEDEGVGTGCGGVIGIYSGQPAWGALGYRSLPTTNNYGVYGTSAYGSGAGKYIQGGSNSNNVGIGSGFYGDLMGSWVRGDVYGMVVKGSRYSLYVDGQTYTNDVIVQLSKNGSNNEKSSGNRVPTYVTTSTSVDIIVHGTGQVVNGVATVNFDDKFQSLYITDMKGDKGIQGKGFTIKENGKGTSNITFNWIAIGVRKGYENPNIAPELLSNDFDNNMAGFMHNENDTINKGNPIWWDGKTLRFTPMPTESGNTPSNIGNAPGNINPNIGIKPKK
jgi:hypothetical protein